MSDRAAARLVMAVSFLGALALAFFIPLNTTWTKDMGSAVLVRLCIGVVAFVVAAFLGSFILRTLRDGFPDAMTGGPFSSSWNDANSDLEDRLLKQEQLLADLAKVTAHLQASVQTTEQAVSEESATPDA